MEAPLKQRLIGAVVLAALALIFVPMLLKSPDVQDADNANVSLQIPDEPDQDDIKTIDIPLGGKAKIVEQPLANPINVNKDTQAVVEDNTANAAEATIPAPQAESAGTAAGQYSVVYPAKSDAESLTLLAGFKAKGLPAKIQSNGKMFRVNVGPFDSREQAELARLRGNDVVSGGTVVAMDAVTPPLPAASSAAKSIPAVPTAPVATTSAKPLATAVPPVKSEPAVATKSDVIDTSKAFAVQIGAPASEAAAIALRDKARAAGYNSFVQPVETASGRRYRVRIGPEHTREQANLMLSAIKQKLGIDGFVVAHP
jgi:cell division septation protein DedD